MANRLAGETSPYLLQHAHNPVDWYPWGPEALELARREDRPILLSIGYSACHWCHVMERESFEDPGVAAVMNERFVPIKVDREERPDLDALYMQATVAMTGHGGWPMTVFLTPAGEPFYAGTYFPPEPRHGMPSFHQILEGVSNAYRTQRDQVGRQAGQVAQALREGLAPRPRGEDELRDSVLTDALLVLRGQFDEVNGGFGGAPKFPPHAVLPFLLRMHRRLGSDQALHMAVHTLDRMAAGGIHDQLGGGFARYSVDARWLVPHFEKMLYDNALLASAYTAAYAATGEDRHRETAEDVLDYLLRELRLEHGGFASAQDADTEGEEGLTYVWTPVQVREVLGADAALVEQVYGVTDAGNFEGGTTVLSRVREPAEAAAETGIAAERLPELRARLLEARAQRPQPARDDKALASWNGMALAALAEAGRRFDRGDYVDAARATAGFLLGPLSAPDGGLYRTHRDGHSHIDAFLDDYAQVANGLWELHLATGEQRWLDEARRLARLAVARFADDDAGGFFDTPSGGEELIARPKEVDDNPTPSGNATLAHVLLRLARHDDDVELERLAWSVLRLVLPVLTRAPQAFGHALSLADALLSPPRTVTITGPAADALAAEALRGFDPDLVVVRSGPLLHGKETPGAYVCEAMTCQAPVAEPEALRAALGRP